jgi:plastocyanin
MMPAAAMRLGVAMLVAVTLPLTAARHLPAWTLAATLEEAAQSARGTLVGRVEIRHAALPVRRPDVADLGAAASPHLPDLRQAVVYLETAPSGAFEHRPAGRARMDQRDETFLPGVLAVTVGAEVDFPNNDSIYHNVFSLSRTKRFDLGRYPRGRSRSVVFDRAGVVRVFCDIHSHMSAFILVFNHPYHATSGAAGGRYRIEGVPPGTYDVSAWYEGETRQTRTVTIGPGGGEVELDFVVP